MKVRIYSELVCRELVDVGGRHGCDSVVDFLFVGWREWSKWLLEPVFRCGRCVVGCFSNTLCFLGFWFMGSGNFCLVRKILAPHALYYISPPGGRALSL